MYGGRAGAGTVQGVGVATGQHQHEVGPTHTPHVTVVTLPLGPDVGPSDICHDAPIAPCMARRATHPLLRLDHAKWGAIGPLRRFPHPQNGHETLISCGFQQ
jgi:hypothetical protein